MPIEKSREKETINLPSVIPVFPLSGVILIPGSTLPLNIFEPRYLQMVRDAAASHKLIGMVQPAAHENDSMVPDLFNIGGVGIIEDLTELTEDRLSIRLRGLARFKIMEELSATTPYRQIHADWHTLDTATKTNEPIPFSRRELLISLSNYLEFQGLDADFEAISEAPDDVLINTLAMVIPFGIAEKQALLEARSEGERAAILQTLLAMSVISETADGQPHVH